MSGATFSWMGRSIPFQEGESIASALDAAGIVFFGPGVPPSQMRFFCGIGACQCCLVRVDGATREACLTAAAAGLEVEPAGGAHG